MNEEKFIEKNGKTYKKKGEKYVRILEKDEIESILFMTHDHATGGHFGIDATYNKISEKYFISDDNLFRLYSNGDFRLAPNGCHSELTFKLENLLQIGPKSD